MKMLNSVLILGMFLLSVGFASSLTLISGKIYNSDYSQAVEGAYVEVNCNGNVQNTTSNAQGDYSFVFSERDCNDGDEASVLALHPDYGSGSMSGIVENDVFRTWDLAVINVPMTPEFGLIGGMFSLFAGVAIFFFVRRD